MKEITEGIQDFKSKLESDEKFLEQELRTQINFLKDSLANAEKYLGNKRTTNSLGICQHTAMLIDVFNGRLALIRDLKQNFDYMVLGIKEEK